MNGPFTYSGCREAADGETCALTELPAGYVATTPGATTVAGLGAISCDDTTKIITSGTDVKMFRPTVASTPPTVTCSNGVFTYDGCRQTYRSDTYNANEICAGTMTHDAMGAGNDLAGAYNACLAVGNNCVGFSYKKGGKGWRLYSAINQAHNTHDTDWNCYQK